MPRSVVITPKRSVAFFAFVAIVMVMLSYVLVILLAAACVYLPYLAMTNTDYVQMQLILLFLGGLAVAGAVLWALVPRRDKFQAPGLLLERAAHPALFAELDDISSALDEPLPQGVYLMGDVNAFVTDRGGVMGMATHRILAIGLPLVSILTVSEFRAILAHEFAHYYSGDTRMGPWVYKAQNAMVRTFQNLGAVGRIRVGAMQIMLAVVIFLLKWYFIFFLRITHFISRRKEYRADELACLVAGPEALMTGLKKIHAGTMAWPVYWNTEVVPVLEAGCIPPIGEGLEQFLTAPRIAEQVARGFERELLDGKTKPYDTHPPLRDRIAAIQGIKSNAGRQDDRPALYLLSNAECTERKFLETLNPKLSGEPLRHVRWADIADTVIVPSWRQSVGEYASLLESVNTDSLPEYAQNLAWLGSKIRDPKGMLLNPEQRRHRAVQLLTMAMGLLLLDEGWKLRLEPGSFSINRGDEKLDLYVALEELMARKLSVEEWRARCAHWGIGGKLLTTGLGQQAADQKAYRDQRAN